MSDDEIEDRWVRQNIFTEDITKDYIKENSRAIWLNKYIDKYQNKSIRNKIIYKITGKKLFIEPEVPQNDIDRVYEKFYEAKKSDLDIILNKFKIDYILLDSSDLKYAGVENKLKKYGFIKPIENIDNYNIYKVD
jgi:hypothetical protein